MMDENNNDDERIKKKKNRKRFIIFSCLIFGIFVISSLFITLLLLLIRLNIIQIKFHNNSNNVYHLAEGSSVHDLHTFTLRDHKLYRYGNHPIVLRKDEVFEDFMKIGNEEKDEVIVITATEKYPYELSMSCEGVCECYYGEIEEERRGVGSLVYSSRVASVVVVSVLGFAAAKFVDNHIDGCYSEARSVLGFENEEELTCYMEESDCNEDDILSKYNDVVDRYNFGDEDAKYFEEVYECQGHCITRTQRTNDYLTSGNQNIVSKVECENQNCEKQIITIRSSQFLPDQDLTIFAKRQYAESFLVPYCYTHTAFYEIPLKRGEKMEKPLYPCTAFSSGTAGTAAPYKNVNCRLIKNMEEGTEKLWSNS